MKKTTLTTILGLGGFAVSQAFTPNVAQGKPIEYTRNQLTPPIQICYNTTKPLQNTSMQYFPQIPKNQYLIDEIKDYSVMNYKTRTEPEIPSYDIAMGRRPPRKDKRYHKQKPKKKYHYKKFIHERRSRKKYRNLRHPYRVNKKRDHKKHRHHGR